VITCRRRGDAHGTMAALYVIGGDLVEAGNEVACLVRWIFAHGGALDWRPS
jgi:hypothetical protein